MKLSYYTVKLKIDHPGFLCTRTLMQMLSYASFEVRRTGLNHEFLVRTDKSSDQISRDLALAVSQLLGPCDLVMQIQANFASDEELHPWSAKELEALKALA